MAEKKQIPGTGGDHYIPYEERTGAESIVYFTRDLSAEGLRRIFQRVSGNITGKTGIKLHTGKPHSPNIIPRPWVKELIEKDLPGASIVETNSYYEGGRYTTEQHRETLKVNGWTFCPVDIMDEDGAAPLPVKNGKWFTEMYMGKDIYPSWLYAVNMGATTVWERWNSINPDGTFDESGMNSLNHYAYGSIGDWMYRKIAGINQLEPGYKKILIKPMFVKGIEEAGAELESPYGKIVSRYSCKDGKIQIHVEIPANTTAVIVLPEKEEKIKTGSGIYDYEYDTATSLKAERFSMDSTLAEIAAQPLAVQMFEQFAPGMLDGPMIQFAMQMTLSEMLGAAPEARPMFEAVVAALNDQE